VAVGVGDAAPPFVLPGTGDRTYSLADYAGHKVVLAFYPGDFTPVCTKQLGSYSEDMGRFEELGARVLGISPQDVASHERFACQEGLRFPLLADVDKSVGDAYGIVGPLGFYRRAVFVIDGTGTIRYVHRSASGMSFVPADDLLDAVHAAVANA
jgi:peroxiredoxin Q/BCP